MKKTILLAIVATILFSTAIAQEKSKPVIKTISDSAYRARINARSADTMTLFFDGKVLAQIVPKSDTLVVRDVKFIKVGQKVYSVDELSRPEAVALMVPLTWIVANYQYMDNSNGGLSKKQVEELQQPLAQYYQYYMYMMQQRQQQNQAKQ